jgi:PAS domain S-box-containing protein
MDVLVVDDSLTVRMDLEEAFVEAGFAPTLCADVASARQVLAARRFSLVVLDVLLPDGDGLELLAGLKGSPEHAATPVILLSTEAEVADRVRGLRIGADEYVGKPYDAAYVVSRAQSLVRRAGEAPSPPPGRPLILVVDDSLTARESLRADLEAAGLDVASAASGEEGLRLATERGPTAVVVDGVMEGMDGAAFVRALRADPAIHGTPCILLTAGGTIGELGALEAGADAYLRKDEGHAVVLARLQALLRNAAPGGAAGAALLGARRVVLLGDGRALRAIAAGLREDGHDVVLASRVEEALELLEVERVDALVVDGTGALEAALAACRRVKAERAWRDVPLLLVGAGDEPERVITAVGEGADDYVALAAGPEVVRARVRALVRRHELEEEKRERDVIARSASILETISDAFFAVDRSWRLVYVNRAFEAMLGETREALAGALLWECCSWLAEGPPAEALRRAVAERVPETLEVAAPGDRWVELRMFPHAGGVSAYLRDVTERRRSQEVQGHLLGIVGHDLRTPLTAVTASASLLLRDAALSEKSRRAVLRVATASTRMSRLIGDLLDYSRARLGQPLPVRPQPAHFDAICREVMDEVLATFPGRSINYECEGDGLGVWDRGRVQQVLVNLLVNALRHGAEEQPVTLSWIGTADEKVVSVHNHGPAISPWLKAHLFEPFRRGDAAGNDWGGVGLGLYIVRQIVVAHGGAVSVRSGEGEGTTFEVRLPSVAPGASRDASPDLSRESSPS